ncbi:8481_t:CDS:2 [Dentiscutata erythropus]|uniref:8481_t:CDS:1 n=1 Tax=Dentiscutata erythropus TaxID=1348616 RepID=A0A9N8WEX7_9GLOM|nr:8481_t:CDS:2 [Dentiscutata erythropus]
MIYYCRFYLLKDWTAPVKKVYKQNRAYKKIGTIRVKQQLNAIKNSADQVEAFRKQFVDDVPINKMDEEALVKKTKIKNTSSNENSAYVKEKNMEELVEFLQKRRLFLNANRFEILRNHEIIGRDFLKMSKQDFKDIGIEMGLAMYLADLANKLNDEINPYNAISSFCNYKDSSNEFKKFTELNMNKLHKEFIGGLSELFNDNLNKTIRSEFQNIKGDIEKIRLRWKRLTMQ